MVQSSPWQVLLKANAAMAEAARAMRLTQAQHRNAKSTVHALISDIYLFEVTEDLVEEAAVLAEEEALRGYDAIHLAAAVSVGASVLSSADDALCVAAGRRGLHVANPLVT